MVFLLFAFDCAGVGSSGNVREFLAAQLVPYLARSQVRSSRHGTVLMFHYLTKAMLI